MLQRKGRFALVIVAVAVSLGSELSTVLASGASVVLPK